MERIPLTRMQKRCLMTYVNDDIPVNRISHIMRNKGILQIYPKTISQLIDAIIEEGNLAFALYRSLISTLGPYELSLCLRQEAELYRWVWVCPCGDILQKSERVFKNEDLCLQDGYKGKIPYVHVCLEIIQDRSKCATILV